MTKGSLASLGIHKEITVQLLSFLLYSVGWLRFHIFMTWNKMEQTQVEGKGRKRIRNKANWGEQYSFEDREASIAGTDLSCAPTANVFHTSFKYQHKKRCSFSPISRPFVFLCCWVKCVFLRTNSFSVFCGNFIAVELVLYREKSQNFPYDYSLNSENQYARGMNLVFFYLTSHILG